MQDKFDRLWSSNFVIQDFWRLVELTDGEFDPRNFSMKENASGTTIGFTWRGKSFQFPFGGSANYIPPINAILQHEGSSNGFAVLAGTQSNGWMSHGSPEVVFGPVELLDTLETEYGVEMTVR